MPESYGFSVYRKFLCLQWMILEEGHLLKVLGKLFQTLSLKNQLKIEFLLPFHKGS